MDFRILFAAVLIGATSAGCDHPDDFALDYLCSDAHRMTVTYFGSPKPVNASVEVGDEVYELPLLSTAGGARYADDKVTWLTAGEHGTLTRQGTSLECVELTP